MYESYATKIILPHEHWGFDKNWFHYQWLVVIKLFWIFDLAWLGILSQFYKMLYKHIKNYKNIFHYKAAPD